MAKRTSACVNIVFMEHYQQLAHGHFIIRRLERRYGAAEIEMFHSRIAAVERQAGSRAT